MRGVVTVTLLFGVGYYAYAIGLAQRAVEVERLRADLRDAIEATQAARESASLATHTAQQAEAQAQAWQARYSQEVPRGTVAEILAQIETKLSQGVPAERLAFILEAAAVERDCAARTETASVFVRTPLNTEPVPSTGFADNRIVVTSSGEPARDQEGLALSEFDPQKPIVLRFLKIDGEVDTARGYLPMSHAVVQGEREYRFIVRGSIEPGTVAMTMEDCAYP